MDFPIEDDQHRRAAWWSVLPVVALAIAAAVVLVSPPDANSSPAIRLAAIAVLLCTGLLWAAANAQGRHLASIRRQARTDELTGLANRRRMLEALQTLVDDGRPFALLLIDLDRFKEVNDSLGHAMGDDLLRRIRPRLEHALASPDDLACRLGGDEFALILAECDNHRARAIAESIRTQIMQPFSLAHTDVLIDASIGISVHPVHADNPTRLLRLADIAMYEAKRGRTGVAEYRMGLDRLANDRLQLANDLRESVRRNQLKVHLQPKVDLRTGSPVGAEALVRWTHPTRGHMKPEDFLQIALDTGQAGQLTMTVLDLALASASEWIADGLDLSVAVNLYESDLRSDLIVARISEALERHVVPASALTVEITEQSLVSDPIGARKVLEQLSDLGIAISLDDYGTGYSSLAYLREFPIDELKLDKLFAQQMVDDQTSWVIVRSTIELAHALGIRVVAEGIEDAATLEELLTLGCDRGQGYFWSAPLSAQQFQRWVNGRTISTGTSG
jgi:diguanylate cyclase